VITDLNGDNRPDVVTMHSGDNNAVITPLLNNSGPMSNLRVTVSQSENTVGLGRQMAYTIHVANDGPDAAAGVTLSAEISLNGQVLSITPEQGTCSGSNSVVCAMGDLPTGAGVSLAFVVAPTSLDEPLWLAAGIGGSSADPDLGDNGSALPTTVTVAEPLAPTVVSVTGSNGRATVSFAAPVSDGGAAVSSYTVTAFPGGITATGSASPVTVTGLTSGISYSFTVAAANSVGTGPESAPSAGLMICPLGDLTLNGNVDLTDALLALRIAVNIVAAAPAQFEVGDLAPFSNGVPAQNGSIDIADALLILRKVVKLIDF
jgi:uncharacterized repeat protein (TIGR01451 family)